MVLAETASAAKSATWSNARRGRPLNKGERKDIRWAMGLEASSRPGDHMHGINLHGIPGREIGGPPVHFGLVGKLAKPIHIFMAKCPH